METTRKTSQIRGFTIVELMIAVAIIAIITAIAIPAYIGYVEESQFAAARSNVEPLRIALEDYGMDNDGFANINGQEWNPAGNQTLQAGDPNSLGWQPTGDNDQFTYQVTGANANTYTITVTHINSGNWVQCQRNTACTTGP